MTKTQEDYLNQLKNEGINNVMGAIRYLEKDFNLSNDEAKNIIREYNLKYGFVE